MTESNETDALSSLQSLDLEIRKFQEKMIELMEGLGKLHSQAIELGMTDQANKLNVGIAEIAGMMDDKFLRDCNKNLNKLYNELEIFRKRKMIVNTLKEMPGSIQDIKESLKSLKSEYQKVDDEWEGLKKQTSSIS